MCAPGHDARPPGLPDPAQLRDLAAFGHAITDPKPYTLSPEAHLCGGPVFELAVLDKVQDLLGGVTVRINPYSIVGS